MTIPEWFAQAETVELNKDQKYSELHKFYKRIRDSRTSIEKLVSQMKKKEGDVKNVLIEKLDTDELPSVKTEHGTIFTKVSKHVTTENAEALLSWVREGVILEFLTYLIDKAKLSDTGTACSEYTVYLIKDELNAYLARKGGHTDCLYLLKKNPCTEAAIKELSEETQILPPGLKWFCKRELNFKK